MRACCWRSSARTTCSCSTRACTEKWSENAGCSRLYLVLFAAYAVAYRDVLRRYNGLAVLALGIAFLIVSALFDEYSHGQYLLEDGAKLMGIGTIVSLFVVIAYTRLRTIHLREESETVP